MAADRAVQGVLDDLASRNHVRVTKFAAMATHGRVGGVRRRRVSDEVVPVRAMPAALILADEVRVMLGQPTRWLRQAYDAMGGDLVAVTPNLRTTVGIDYVADSLGKSASRPTVAEYLALSENATAPAAGDTSLTGEITTNGLARAIATYAHTVAATSYTLSKTWTASGAFTAVQKAGMFTAVSGGTMPFENTFTATALAINDQLSVVWTVNV